MTTAVTFTEMLHRLLRAEGQGRAAKTVEASGIWRRQDSFDFAMMTRAEARAADKGAREQTIAHYVKRRANSTKAA